MLFACVNSTSFRMFIDLEIGCPVIVRWIAARIPVKALGVRSVFLFVFTSAKNFRRIPFSSVGLTVWRSQLIFRFSSHWVNFFKPQEVYFLVFTGTQSASNFCRSSSSSWEDCKFTFSSLFTAFSAMVWAWKWRYHFFHQRSKTRRREHSMASRFWLAA